MTPLYNITWLTQKIESGERLKFIYFWGHSNPHPGTIGKFCLSQWFESPFTVDNITYLTSEHYMMAQKALLFNDQEVYQKIITSTKPGEAKDLGRQVKGFNEQTWKENRYGIVIQANLHKFGQNPVLAEYLIKTGERILVEASPIDPIWGIGMAQDDLEIDKIYAWRGLNLLGFALMEVRDTLK